jgi:threonine dehydrogenase-like Zn-dependent dehydrogenase
MQALVYKGNGQISLEEKPVPVIIDPTDAIVKGYSFGLLARIE